MPLTPQTGQGTALPSTPRIGQAAAALPSRPQIGQTVPLTPQNGYTATFPSTPQTNTIKQIEYTKVSCACYVNIYNEAQSV